MSALRKLRRALSTPPKSLWPDGVAHHGARIALAVAMGISVTLLFPPGQGIFIGSYEVGDVAGSDVRAEVGFPVLKDPGVFAAQQDSAAAEVPPTFQYQRGVRDDRLEELAAFFRRVDSAREASGAQGVSDILASSLNSRASDDVAVIMNQDEFDRLRQSALRALANLGAGGVIAGGVANSLRSGPLRVVQDGVERMVDRSSVLSPREFYAAALRGEPEGPTSNLLSRLLATYLPVTLMHDVSRSAREEEEARASVSRHASLVSQGAVILRVGDQVTTERLETLDSYRRELQNRGIAVNRSDLRSGAANAILSVFLLLAFGAILSATRPAIYHRLRFILMLAAICAVYFVTAFVLERAGLAYTAIPVVFVSISVAVLWDSRVAIMAAFVVAAVTAIQPPFSDDISAFVALAASGTTAALIARAYRRLSQAWLYIGVVLAAYLVIILALWLKNEDLALAEMLLSALTSTVVGTLVAIGSVPVYEFATGLATPATLTGLVDPNRPLLLRMSDEAPGTFNHSAQVAAMGAAGARAIGADAILTRAGLFYHDIGKLAAPEMFAENLSGESPHESMSPRESARVILGHVTEGMKMARSWKLPRALDGFIQQHHGDTVLEYFLDLARAEAEAKGLASPDPKDFSYQGPKPQTRETGIAMLADAAESATRAMKTPGKERIEKLVAAIFEARVQEGQLSECPLTLRDLNVLQQRFVRFLTGAHHRRAAYPKTRHLTQEP